MFLWRSALFTGGYHTFRGAFTVLSWFPLQMPGNFSFP
jgi:hypothetical protein